MATLKYISTALLISSFTLSGATNAVNASGTVNYSAEPSYKVALSQDDKKKKKEKRANKRQKREAAKVRARSEAAKRVQNQRRQDRSEAREARQASEAREPRQEARQKGRREDRKEARSEIRRDKAVNHNRSNKQKHRGNNGNRNRHGGTGHRNGGVNDRDDRWQDPWTLRDEANRLDRNAERWEDRAEQRERRAKALKTQSKNHARFARENRQKAKYFKRMAKNATGEDRAYYQRQAKRARDAADRQRAKSNGYRDRSRQLLRKADRMENLSSHMERRAYQKRRIIRHSNWHYGRGIQSFAIDWQLGRHNRYYGQSRGFYRGLPGYQYWNTDRHWSGSRWIFTPKVAFYMGSYWYGYPVMDAGHYCSHGFVRGGYHYHPYGVAPHNQHRGHHDDDFAESVLAGVMAGLIIHEILD